MRRIEFKSKKCLFCGSTFKRERDNSGRLQDSSLFKRRKFCTHMCYLHYNSGPHHYKWKGGVAHYCTGYIFHSRTGRGIHRIVMERYIGRKLKEREVVHHIDGNKKNNDINNLEIMSQSEHAKLHAIQHREHRKQKDGLVKER